MESESLGAIVWRDLFFLARNLAIKLRIRPKRKKRNFSNSGILAKILDIACANVCIEVAVYET